MNYAKREMQRAAQCCRERLERASKRADFKRLMREGSWFDRWLARTKVCGADLDVLKDAAMRVRMSRA